LSNAGAAGVGENDTTELLEGLELTILGNSSPDLFRPRGNEENRLGLDAVVESITGNASSAVHVLVRAVGAGSDQADLELLGPVVVLGSLGELGDRGSKIGGEGAVDMGLELGQVDLDQLVVLGALVLAELVSV
jgi:hypothetical protein